MRYRTHIVHLTNEPESRWSGEEGHVLYRGDSLADALDAALGFMAECDPSEAAEIVDEQGCVWRPDHGDMLEDADFRAVAAMTINQEIIDLLVRTTIEQFFDGYGREPSLEDFENFTADYSAEAWLSDYVEKGGDATADEDEVKAAVMSAAREELS